MSRLDEIQKALAGSLTRGTPPPDGCDAAQVVRAAKSLEAKRRRAAEHLLPELRRALGPRWMARFHEHSASYIPAGMLYHVDDAWELAERECRSSDAAARRGARADLATLRRRYSRGTRRGPDRVRERRTVMRTARDWLRRVRALPFGQP